MFWSGKGKQSQTQFVGSFNVIESTIMNFPQLVLVTDFSVT